jgi:hypothetical protein
MSGDQTGNADKLDKEISGKGPKDAFPKGQASLDAQAPEVKKKDGAQYKDVENMKKQVGAE